MGDGEGNICFCFPFSEIQTVFLVGVVLIFSVFRLLLEKKLVSLDFPDGF